MEFNLDKKIRPHLVEMKTYSSSRPVENEEQFTFLDANENPFGIYNRYPDATHFLLRKKLTEINEVDINKIFLGNGSDELIDLAMRIFCEPEKDSIMILDPSFVMYEIYAKMNNLKVEKVKLNSDYQLDKKKFESAVSCSKAKILFLCSPNNPTGNSIDDLEFFIKNFSGIVVVDEAYIEFSPFSSSLQFLQKYPNLIVLKTLSKAYGMAGLRIGVGFASPEIARIFNQFKPPYNISSESQKLALQSLQNEIELRKNIQLILVEKEKLQIALSENPLVVKIFPSDANFFLVQFKSAEIIYQKFSKAKIFTSLRHPILKNCIRITVGTAFENSSILKILSEIKEP